MKTDINELNGLLFQTKLKIDEDKKEEMIKRLNKDLEFVEKLFEVNVDGVEPLYHVTKLEDVRRDDVTGETLDNETIMNLARVGEYGYIVVPAVPAALESSEHKTKSN